MTLQLKRSAVLGSVVVVCMCVAQRPALGQGQRERKPVVWVNPKLPEGNGLEHKVHASRTLGHDVGYVVWTPPEFDDSGKTRYPVIYFLHGIGGTESADAGGFSSLVARGIRGGEIPPAICVFPNGGRSGYRGDVESMITAELIPLVDRTYPTHSDAAARAVAGFSMGGAGAVRLSLLHPELFCAAGSWGGGLSRRGSGDDSPLLEAAKSNAERLKKNHFAMLLVNGDGDRPEAFAALSKTLEPLEVPHEIVVLKDTKHNLGLYYKRAGKPMTEFLGKQLKLGQTPPK